MPVEACNTRESPTVEALAYLACSKGVASSVENEMGLGCLFRDSFLALLSSPRLNARRRVSVPAGHDIGAFLAAAEQLDNPLLMKVLYQYDVTPIIRSGTAKPSSV